MILKGSRLGYTQFDTVALLAETRGVMREYQDAPAVMQLGEEMVVADSLVAVFDDCVTMAL